MKLGQHIQTLRTQKNLSQSEVADALGVSRQSVSKWETDASVPELEKLLALSDLFGITLDELVRGDSAPESASAAPAAPHPAEAPAAAHAEHFFGRKLAGTLFLCFGALVWLLCALLGDALSGLFLSAPFVLLGILCLCIRKHTVLWCLWAACGCVLLYLYFATGISWRLTRLSAVYTPEMNYARLFISWLELLSPLALMLVTAFRFSARPLAPNPGLRKKILSALACCAALAYCLVPLPTPNLFSGRIALTLWLFFLDASRCALLTALSCFALRLLRALRTKKA